MSDLADSDNLTIVKAEDPLLLDMAYQCHHDWFVQSRYIEPLPSGRYTDEWSEASAYYLVGMPAPSPAHPISDSLDAIGMVRLITQAPFPIQSQFDFSREWANQLISVSSHYGLQVSALAWERACADVALPHLYRVIWNVAARLEKSILLACIDINLIRLMKSQGIPIQIAGHSKYLMGSETAPCYVFMSELQAHLPIHNPELWDIMSRPLEIPVV